MKLKQVLIEGGIVYANPGMEYPKFKAWRDSIETEVEAIKQWRKGMIAFEDQEKVRTHLPKDAFGGLEQNNGLYNGLASVDLDVTVVRQWRSKATTNGALAMKGDGGKWHSMMEDDSDPDKEYRRALRIN